MLKANLWQGLQLVQEPPIAALKYVLLLENEKPLLIICIP
jgi:hypothetical protein